MNLAVSFLEMNEIHFFLPPKFVKTESRSIPQHFVLYLSVRT